MKVEIIAERNGNKDDKEQNVIDKMRKMMEGIKRKYTKVMKIKMYQEKT